MKRMILSVALFAATAAFAGETTAAAPAPAPGAEKKAETAGDGKADAGTPDPKQAAADSAQGGSGENGTN